MSFSRRMQIACVAIIAALTLIVACLFYTVQTNWFQAKLQSRVIAAIQNATGTRATLDSVRFNPTTGSLELRNLVLRGSETVGSTPLFKAPLIQAGVKLSSLFIPKLNLKSIAVHQPQVSVMIAPDGTTNLPAFPAAGKHDIFEDLLNLGVDHFELDHASLRLNDESIRFDAKGAGLKIVWTRLASNSRSKISLVSNDVSVQYGQLPAASFDVNLAADLGHDRITVSDLLLKTGDSTVEASGLISHLTRPDARLRVRAQLAAQDLARMCSLPNLSAGHATFEGNADYAPYSGFAVEGKITGEGLAYSSRAFTAHNVNLESDLQAANDDVRFRSFALTSPLAKLKGTAELSGDGKFSMNAAVTAASIQKLALASGNSIPWSGLASGNVSITARNLKAITATSNLSITPAPGGIPVSGQINASLNGSSQIGFEDSKVELPGTQLSFSGVPNSNLQLTIASNRLDDLRPLFSFAGFQYGANSIPLLGPEAAGSFQGSLAGPLTNPVIDGHLAMQHFHLLGRTWTRVQSSIDFCETSLAFDSLTVNDDGLRAQAKGKLGLANWRVQSDSPFQLNARVQSMDLGTPGSPLTHGNASGNLDLSGSLQQPVGTAKLNVTHLDIYGQPFESVRLDGALAAGVIRIERGRMQSGLAAVDFNGTYKHAAAVWGQGQLALRVDSNEFPLKTVAVMNRRSPEVSAQMEAHGDVVMSLSATDSATELRPVRADGTVFLRGISFGGRRLGTVLVKAQTSEKELTATLSGDLQESLLRGSASVQLQPDLPLAGEAQFGKLDLRAVSSLLGVKPELRNAVTGSMDGKVSISGPLEDPRHWRSELQLTSLQIKPDAESIPQAAKLSDLVFQNAGPVVIEADGGLATVRNLQIKGKDTSLTAAGSFDLLGSRPANLKVKGSLNMRTFGLLDSRLDSSGESDVIAAVTGALSNPAINGTLQVKNGSFFFRDVTNGLTAVNGTILFNRDRATIQTLTADSGGGTLRLGGFVSFGTPGTLIYGLDARAEKVRLRYAGGISVTADADLRLSGSSSTSLLSGTATVSRVVLSANTDVGNVFANFAAPRPAPANQKDFVSGLHFDVSIQSAANLELNTALSRNLEADIDLHLRGTPDRPILLGNVTANQGDIKVFGTRYTINRGEVTFVNSVKIEPVLDVDLQTETRGITVDITIAGTVNKLNITYRSDPPLQPRDIIALLAVGRAPSDVTSQQSTQVSSEASQLQSGAYSALGQAMSPNSSRLSKLFGVTTIKIDPLVEGIAYNQARLTLEEQLSRDVTVTYVTNLAQTAEQIFRVEWALNRQYSIVALRDDNGEFGIDFLYKKSFK